LNKEKLSNCVIVIGGDTHPGTHRIDRPVALSFHQSGKKYGQARLRHTGILFGAGFVE
jgi:hypothetical protein